MENIAQRSLQILYTFVLKKLTTMLQCSQCSLGIRKSLIGNYTSQSIKTKVPCVSRNSRLTLKFAEIQISNFVRQKIRFEIFLLGTDYMNEANRTSPSERGLVPSLARMGFIGSI